MILRDGFKVNHKRTERLYYRELNLGLKGKKMKRRYRSEARISIHLKNELHLKKLSIIETSILLNNKITQNRVLERFRIKAKIIILAMIFLYFTLMAVVLLNN
ncbi:MAG: hypothetical protein COW00_11795 [Bdellovibrio sp. CG12_big_fil_rev_8_21_14_0_65_39_13]|nr:MAG: hypothetical protein COW78_12015 [Bdellovibrio sp. CG22_combo_CG10-13_8_21_14_all_39_27]PIQ59188.1 MAG: hypothetical protein COW00_11795 [Bdellovibrio sp. CG12_big_fil_rev_8_21_14_0_65_39_13]PIR32714.1 MAG: hypothetical protein COV37_18940 [Bdellovibrio sp. CG11_big_fil_rev_8_21_14_0_20_39_38]